MKKIFVLFAACALSALTASAITVQYGTSGTFSCTDVAGSVSGCNSATIQFGTLPGTGIQMAFQGLPTTTTVNATTSASLGDIVVSCIGGGTACASQNIPVSLTLTINVTQILPSAGGPVGIPAGSIVGAVSGTSNSAVITWPGNNTINIGVISYRVANNPLNLVPPSSQGGDTSVQGVITDNSVPEPATFGMFGAALIGLGLLRRRS